LASEENSSSTETPGPAFAAVIVVPPDTFRQDLQSTLRKLERLEQNWSGGFRAMPTPYNGLD